MTGSGFTSWVEFAAEVFLQSARLGGPTAQVRAIASADYPAAAKRPANSRLDCSKLADIHNVALPVWQTSLKPCVKRLIDEALPQETHL
jgi:dTDP-4-dehydrorhamnose reductase